MVLFAFFFSGHDHHHHHQQHGHSDLLPHTHIAYHHVESACASDVELLCSPKEELPQSTGDPILDWLFLPAAPPPPEMEDLSRLMDQMMNSFIMAPVSHVSVYWYEEPVQQAPHFMVDSMAAKLAAAKEPEEIPELTLNLQSLGYGMMQEHEEHSVGHRMARRLTELDSKTIQHTVHLPFGCARNRCLTDAFDQSKVSGECAHSIRQLESTYHRENMLEQKQAVFLGMVWVYIFVLGLLLVLLARKYTSHRSDRRMRIRILQAIYSNPALKEQVEEELGESVGSVPPLPYHVLRLISSGGKDLKRQLLCLKRVRIIFFMALFTLVFVAPFWVLPICIGISMARVFQLCFAGEADDRDCECCCCGASTTDAANGNLTEAQACCGCCKGTGVCAPSCASCCGSGGCCCDMKKIKAPDDCTCCCCGVTLEQVSSGTQTEAQMCCNCCKGTGTCDPACASCCGKGGCCCCCGATEKAAREGTLTQTQACCSCCSGTGCCSSCCDCCCKPTKKGRGQKHIFQPKHAIYAGVPLQVV